MAKKKNPRTRFVISVGGLDREFLSVEDRPDGSLLVLTKGGDAWGGVVDQPHSPRNIHYSVHSSRNSPAFLIKETVVLEEDQRLERVAFVQPGPQGLVAPLKMARTADLRIESYVPVVGDKDQIIRIGQFDPATANLIFFAVVTERDRSWPWVHEITSTKHDFAVFSLIIYHALHLGPSLGYSFELKAFSGGVSIDGKPPEWRTEGGVASLSDEELRYFFDAGIAKLAGGYVEQLGAACGRAGLPFSDHQKTEAFQWATTLLPVPLTVSR